jgi:hypothetical protein
VVASRVAWNASLATHGLNDFIEVKQIFTAGTGLATKVPYAQVKE